MIARFVGVFLTGIAAGAWFMTVSVELKASREAAFRDELRGIVQEISTESAEKLESQLKELRSNEIHTEQIIRTETIKPVFSNICASDDYVRVLNQSIDRAERTLSGQSDSKMPGQPAPPER